MKKKILTRKDDFQNEALPNWNAVLETFEQIEAGELKGDRLELQESGREASKASDQVMARLGNEELPNYAAILAFWMELDRQQPSPNSKPFNPQG